LISEESTNGSASGVTYSGNYRENVQPVSGARRGPRQTGNTLVEESNGANRQVPPSTIQQSAPAKSSSNNSNNDDDVPDLGI
jgi:hypothetical protein